MKHSRVSVDVANIINIFNLPAAVGIREFCIIQEIRYNALSIKNEKSDKSLKPLFPKKQ